jgi:O-antigen/teichoic acid export membrane protein
MRLKAGQLVGGTLWVTASRVIEGVVALVYSIVVARTLGGDYGFIGAAMGVWGILNIVTRMGIPQATTRYVASLRARGENDAARATVATTFILEAVISLVCGVVLFLLADVLAQDVFGKAEMGVHLRIVSPMLMFAGVAGVWLSVVQGLHRYRYFAIQTSVNPVIRLGASLAFLAMGWGVEGALLGYLLGHVMALVTGTVLAGAAMAADLPRDRRRIKDAEGPPGARGLLKFGAAVTIGTTAAMVFEWTDKLMLAAMGPIEEVAFYTIAFGMVSLPLLIPRAINITFFPAVSTLHGEGDMDGLRTTIERVMGLTMVMMAFIPVAMMAIAPWIVGLLYGEFFLPAVAPFLVLSVWGLVRPVGLLAYSVPKGMGMPMVGAKAMVLTCVLNVGLNVVLIPLFGTIGAAVATTVSYVIGFTYLTHVALQLADATFPWSPVLRAVTSAIVAGAVMFAIFWFYPAIDPSGPSWALILPVLVVGFCGLGVYLAMLGITRAVTPADVELVGSLGIPGSVWVSKALDRIVGIRGGSGRDGD